MSSISSNLIYQDCRIFMNIKRVNFVLYLYILLTIIDIIINMSVNISYCSFSLYLAIKIRYWIRYRQVRYLEINCSVKVIHILSLFK